MTNFGAYRRTLRYNGLALVCLCSTLAVSAAVQRADPMSKIAREYVRLVLAMGQHDKDYVDAYYGPDDIKREAETAKLSLDAIGAGVKALEAQVAAVSPAATPSAATPSAATPSAATPPAAATPPPAATPPGAAPATPPTAPVPFPAGFEPKPQPYGVGFTGPACSEPKLLQLAYAFEQATKKRTPPPGLR